MPANLAATRKMCAEAPMDQEQRFFQALAAATRLVLSREGQVLELYAGDDRLVLRFSRLVEK